MQPNMDSAPTFTATSRRRCTSPTGSTSDSSASAGSSATTRQRLSAGSSRAGSDMKVATKASRPSWSARPGRSPGDRTHRKDQLIGMAQELTAGLARYVCELQFADLPADVVAMAKDVFLDAIGGQLACSTLPHCRMAIEYARQQAGPSDATVLGTEFRTSVEHAALVNGILGHGDEIDEVLELFGHTSAVLVPAVLAAAEREHSSGEDLIVALVAAYDVASRLAIAGFSLDTLGPRNFQQASTAGSVASAAAAGKLLRLDQTAMRAAFGLAAEQACGLQAMRTEDGHMNKSLHMGVGSRNGVAS